VTTNPNFQPDESLVNPGLGDLARMSQQEFRQRFRGSPIARTKYSGLMRNVAVAMGNSGHREYISELERLAESDDPNLAEHARWAMQRLNETPQTSF
jgi:epoxyqueuosine reductase